MLTTGANFYLGKPKLITLENFCAVWMTVSKASLKSVKAARRGTKGVSSAFLLMPRLILYKRYLNIIPFQLKYHLFMVLHVSAVIERVTGNTIT